VIAYRLCTQRAPSLVAGWHGLGVAYRNLGQPAEAVSAFQAAQRLNPQDAFAAEQIRQIQATSEAAGPAPQ
jgi:cytochrome c-type biogenesis protein CcmH/NrfG